MLASHFNIVSMPETSFVRNYIFEEKFSPKYKKNFDLNNILSIFKKDKKLKRLKFNFDGLHHCQSLNFSSFAHLVYNKIIDSFVKDGNLYVLDKDPKLIEYIPALLKLYPKSYVIQIVRDPKDVLVSKKVAKWSKDYLSFRHIVANIVQFKLSIDKRCKFSKKNFLVITYEDLISSPNQVLHKICNTLDLPYDKSMLEFQKSAIDLVSDSEYSWKKETMGPLLRFNTDKWNSQLTRVEAFLVDHSCTKKITSFGYSKKVRFKNLSFPKKIYAFILLCILNLLSYLYCQLHLYRLSQFERRIP